jgi:hypothetical protein
MMPPVPLLTSPTRDLERVVADAHALAKALYAEAYFALDCGFEAEWRRLYSQGEQAFRLGLRTECALLQLRENRDER